MFGKFFVCQQESCHDKEYVQHPLKDALPCFLCQSFLLECCQVKCAGSHIYCPDCYDKPEHKYHKFVVTAQVQLINDEDDFDGFMDILFKLQDMKGKVIVSSAKKLDRTVPEWASISKWLAQAEKTLQCDADDLEVTMVINNYEELSFELRKIMLPPRFYW